ncbi:MAG: NAD(+) diphosphatase [Bacteroidota bacterium]
MQKSEDRVVQPAPKYTLPRSIGFPCSSCVAQTKLYIGQLDDIPVWAAEISTEASPPSSYVSINVRRIYEIFGREVFAVAGYAYQIIHWNRTSKYCGRCGSSQAFKQDEIAKLCPQCQLVTYPRISPAVIMSITKGNRILLARNARFKRGFYSVLAGFVEAGETLEDCVRREIREEVNLEVKNIRYFGSQPWPFPDSLMVGFTTEYASGTVKLEESELDDYGWFTKDELPDIPGKISISRALIDNFVARQTTPKDE